MTVPTVPETYSVEHYVDRIRSMVSDNGDMYAYAFGLATGFSMLTNPPADALKYIENIRAAVSIVQEEQRVAWRGSRAADPVGLDYSREAEPADDPTPVSPARGWHGGSLADETPDEAPTLWAAIRFSDTRREAGRLIGRTTPDLLRTATLDLLHGQALDEDVNRARRADVREGEQGRITDPNLAHFFAKKEEARRQPAELLHMQFTSGDTSCGLTQGEYRDGCGTANQAAVTCKTCIDEMPF